LAFFNEGAMDKQGSHISLQVQQKMGWILGSYKWREAIRKTLKLRRASSLYLKGNERGSIAPHF
jgi:hypothetical protein